MTAGRTTDSIQTLVGGYCGDVASLANLLSETLRRLASQGEHDALAACRPQIGEVVAAMSALTETLHSLPNAPHDTGPHVDSIDVDAAPSLSMYREDQWADYIDTTDEQQVEDKPQQPPVSFAPKTQQTFDSRLIESDSPAPRAEAQSLSEEERLTTSTSLRGRNASMPLPALFHMLERGRKTGVLTVDLEHDVLAFEFERGLLQSCVAKNVPEDERLCNLLDEIGSHDPKAIELMLDQAEGKTGLYAGEVLVRHGLVTNGQLQQALEEQLFLRFRRASQAAEGRYEFRECEHRPTDGRIKIAPMELTFRLRD